MTWYQYTESEIYSKARDTVRKRNASNKEIDEKAIELEVVRLLPDYFRDFAENESISESDFTQEDYYNGLSAIREKMQRIKNER